MAFPPFPPVNLPVSGNLIKTATNFAYYENRSLQSPVAKIPLTLATYGLQDHIYQKRRNKFNKRKQMTLNHLSNPLACDLRSCQTVYNVLSACLALPREARGHTWICTILCSEWLSINVFYSASKESPNKLHFCFIMAHPEILSSNTGKNLGLSWTEVSARTSQIVVGSTVELCLWLWLCCCWSGDTGICSFCT